MKDWIPLLQSLVWPVFLLIVLVRFREPIAKLLATIYARVERGDDFAAGPSGVKIAVASPSAPSGPEPVPGAQPALTVKPTSADSSDRFESAASVVPHIYLAHIARRDPTLDRGGYRYYRFPDLS